MAPETNGPEVGGRNYRRQLGRGRACRASLWKSIAHWGDLEGQGAESWEDTASQRQLHTEGARDRPPAPAFAGHPSFWGESGRLVPWERVAWRAVERQETAQQRHKVQWFRVRKGRHRLVHTGQHCGKKEQSCSGS